MRRSQMLSRGAGILILLVCTTSARMAGQAACAPAPAGLVGWWPGDGDAVDVVRGNNASIEGSVSFATGQVGQAFVCDGSTGVVVPAPQPSRTAGTVMAWLNPSTLTGGYTDDNLPGLTRRAAAGANNDCRDWSIGLYGSKLGALFRIPGGCVGDLQDPEDPVVGTWYHVALTVDGSTATLYVNGVVVASAATDPGYTLQEKVQIGQAYCCPGDAFAGEIDEVELYDRALTGVEIMAVFNADAAGSCRARTEALSVDARDAGTGTNANGVLEQGETVLVAPAWQNGFPSTTPFTGTASNLTGPAGPTYTVDDSFADYGSAAAGAIADCDSGTQDCYFITVAGTRPLQHWDATFSETLTGFSNAFTKTWAMHVGESFSDVPTSQQFYRFIENLFHNGITGGCGGGGYCPDGFVARAQMAVFLLKGEHGKSYTPPACSATIFADEPCPGGLFVDWVNQLNAEGITGGCGGGNYCPTNPVLRQQMAVFLLKTQHGSSYVPPACMGVFADVPCPSQFADWIEQLVTESITGGCGGGNYCPTNPNTRGQMAVFLVKTFGLLLYGP